MNEQDFEEWVEELKELFLQRVGYTFHINEQSFKEYYYDIGLTPLEAFEEEIHCWEVG